MPITVRVCKTAKGSIKTPEHSDTFCPPSMRPGEKIEVEPRLGCPGWYTHKGYNYHESWLIFPKEQKRILFELSALEDSDSNALCHYEIEFSEPVNASWLQSAIRKALDAATYDRTPKEEI